MNKVLMIAYNFNKTDNIGSVRLRGLAKYLPEFGWSPIILTVKTPVKPDKRFWVEEVTFESPIIKWKKFLGLSLNKTLKEQYGFSTYKGRKTTIDRLLDLWKELFAYPDTSIGWVKPAINVSQKLFEKNNFDAILSSSQPPSSHIIAHSLEKRYTIPWIADFRDPWTQNHYYHYSKVRLFFEKRLELKTISRASALTTASKSFADKLKKLHRNKEIFSILNGYDPDELYYGGILSDKFSITHTGNIYSGSQDPDPLFRALHELLIKGKLDARDLEINFYGNVDENIIKTIQKYKLQNVIKFHGKVDRDIAIKSQRESQLLLLLSWNDPKEKGVIPAKIYEYLAAKRPILSIGHFAGGEVCFILDKTKSGYDLTDIEEIKTRILVSYCEFKRQGHVNYYGIPEKIEEYSQKEMASKFANVLNQVSQNKKAMK